MKPNHQNKLFTYWFYDNEKDDWVPFSGISEENIFTERTRQDYAICYLLEFKITKWPCSNKVLVRHFPQDVENGVGWEITYYYLTDEEYSKTTKNAK